MFKAITVNTYIKKCDHLVGGNKGKTQDVTRGGMIGFGVTPYNNTLMVILCDDGNRATKKGERPFIWMQHEVGITKNNRWYNNASQ